MNINPDIFKCSLIKLDRAYIKLHVRKKRLPECQMVTNEIVGEHHALGRILKYPLNIKKPFLCGEQQLNRKRRLLALVLGP